MSKELKAEISRQLKLATEEQQRVKVFLNENNLNCNTALFVIAKNYRDALKHHIKTLHDNLE